MPAGIQSTIILSGMGDITRKEGLALMNDILNINQTGTGDVVGSPPSTDRAIAIYSGATGLLIQNSLATINSGGSLNIPAGQNFTINNVAIGTGNVTGGSSSTDGEIARYNLTTGKIIKASATPVIVSDLGDITLPASRTVFSSTFRALSSTNTSLLADSGGKVIINDSGNLAATAIATDFTGNGGYVAFKAGAVGGVAFGFAANRGFYDGTTQINVSVGGTLVAAFDNVTGGIKTDNINDNGSGTLSVASANHIIVTANDVDMTAVTNGLLVNKISSAALQINVGLTGTMAVVGATYSSGMLSVSDTGTAFLGDGSGDVNGTSVIVNDTAEIINIITTDLQLNSATLPSSTPLQIDTAFFAGGGKLTITKGFISVIA